MLMITEKNYNRFSFFNPLVMPTFKAVHVHGDLSNLMVSIDLCIFKDFISLSDCFL